MVLVSMAPAVNISFYFNPFIKVTILENSEQ